MLVECLVQGKEIVMTIRHTHIHNFEINFQSSMFPEIEIDQGDQLESSLSLYQFSSLQLLSLVQLFVTPWMPDFPVHHQLLELTQTHVHRIGDAIQPSHPLSSPSVPTFNLSQHHFK